MPRYIYFILDIFQNYTHVGVRERWLRAAWADVDVRLGPDPASETQFFFGFPAQAGF
jgi:hypothetical protein